GHLQHVLLLAGGSPHPRRSHRPGPPRRSPPPFRADARLRQPPRPLRRANRQQRRSPRQLPAGFHALGTDQRGGQSGSGAERAVRNENETSARRGAMGAMLSRPPREIAKRRRHRESMPSLQRPHAFAVFIQGSPSLEIRGGSMAPTAT